jgi:superfamily I DNA and/or RNA helicase
MALYAAQVELIRQLVQQSPTLAGAPLAVDLPTAFRERECGVVLLSLTRSHAHRAVPFGDDPQLLTLALTRARCRLVLFGDPGTLARRSQWEGPLDHLDEADAARERDLAGRLVAYLNGQGAHARAFRVREGTSR